MEAVTLSCYLGSVDSEPTRIDVMYRRSGIKLMLRSACA